jgi:hypothetical protein
MNSTASYRIIEYAPKYDVFLEDLDKRSLQGRRIQLELVRDHFLSRAIVFEDYRACILLDKSGMPAGAGASAIVPMLLDGRTYRAGFGFDLKVLPEFRHLHLASHFAAYTLENHFKPGGCTLYFLTSKKSNEEIMRHILTPLFPVFRYDFVYLTLPTGRPLKPARKQGNPQRFFVELLSNAGGLQPYYEITDSGLGIWYLDKCYRLRIRYIHPLLHLLTRAGGWLKKQWSEIIPRVGGEMRMAALYNLTADRLPSVEACLPRLAAQGIQYLLVCCQRNDVVYHFLHPSSINTYDYNIMGSENFADHATLTMDVRCL